MPIRGGSGGKLQIFKVNPISAFQCSSRLGIKEPGAFLRRVSSILMGWRGLAQYFLLAWASSMVLFDSDNAFAYKFQALNRHLLAGGIEVRRYVLGGPCLF